LADDTPTAAATTQGPRSLTIQNCTLRRSEVGGFGQGGQFRYVAPLALLAPLHHQSSSSSFLSFFLAGTQSGSMLSAFHLSQSAFSSFTFSGIAAARSFASPMSSRRLNSFTLFTP